MQNSKADLRLVSKTPHFEINTAPGSSSKSTLNGLRLGYFDFCQATYLGDLL